MELDYRNIQYDKLIDLVFKEDGIISQKKFDYKKRDAQVEAITQILNAVNAGENFILEGPCGFGKSFAYIFPVLLHCMLTNNVAVIATGGIALQEQLFNIDVPFIADIIEQLTKAKPKIVYIKGRSNFLCLRKLDEVENHLKNHFKFSNKDEVKDLVEWGRKTETGDNSELNYIPEFATWSQVACMEPGECKSRKCEHYGKCFYQSLKSNCLDANIIITNYHLLFADVNTGYKILPPYDILVCDEGHEMADIARDFQEVKVGYYTFLNFSKKISELFNKYGVEYINKEVINSGEIVTNADAFFSMINSELNPNNYPQIHLDSTEIQHVDDFHRDIRIFIGRLITAREALCLYGCENTIGDMYDGAIIGEVVIELDFLIDKVRETRSQFIYICSNRNERNVYYATKENNNTLSLRSKPIGVDDYFQKHFFNRHEHQMDMEGDYMSPLTTIITSATLSVNQSFDYIKQQLGLDDVVEMIAKSPFNLTEQELWYLPQESLSGNHDNKDEAQASVLNNFLEVCDATGGGVLGLFTSIRNMNEAANYLRKNTKFHVFLQGERPRQQLLDLFRQDVDSILIGTKSFFTGIDVPGNSLRCVFIDKLPFASPDDPIMRALNKEKNAFMKYSVPYMVIDFKQAVGRGVRTVTDKCVVCVADDRLATARYKNVINNSFFYKKTGTRSIEDVVKFLSE